MTSTLIYLHGFNSSPQSTKSRLLADTMAQRGLRDRFASPALPHSPAHAIAAAEAVASGRDREDICFVGSSLGGFYATWLAQRYRARAVLINPAIDPHQGLSALLGPQCNLYTGEKYELTQAHLDGWEKLCVTQITPERYLLLVETGDEVLDYRVAVQRYAGARQVVVPGGDHSLQSFARHIPLILEFAGIDQSGSAALVR